MAGPFTVAEIAAWFGGRIEGAIDSTDHVADGVASLADAGARDLSFLANRRYRRAAQDSAAGCILVGPDVQLGDRLVIRCTDPYRAFAVAMQHFHPYAAPPAGVDSQAWIAPSARVDGARVDAFAWIGPGAEVGAGAWIQTGAVVGAGSRVGADCRLMPHSVVMDGCTVGDRVWLNPGAVVGAEGFGFAPGPEGHAKIPQVGTAVVEDDVEIGANSCVDRAALGETRVGAGAKLDNLVQVGHAANVGPDVRMVAYSGVAGSSRIGRGSTLAAKAAVLGHIDIGEGVEIGVASAVHDDQPAGARITGVPAIEHRKWLRAATGFSDLPDLIRGLRRLEARVAALESGQEDPS